MANCEQNVLEDINILAEAKLPVGELGVFRFLVFSYADESKEHVALVKNLAKTEVPLVRVHSECLTGDVFSSLRCDCGDQLSLSMKMIAEQGGVFIYLRQEGRGIGLVNKIKAYQLQQEQGFDTVDANTALGFGVDERSFLSAAALLKTLGISDIKLITNNPKKIAELSANGINVCERLPVEVAHNQQNCDYLKTKKDKLGHLIKLNFA